jgi:hypothetical protein
VAVFIISSDLIVFGWIGIESGDVVSMIIILKVKMIKSRALKSQEK